MSRDYLPYQLWTVPSHIFGWLSVSLATSSLLKALGGSPGAAGVAASAAAIKWITKDGIGAAGKLLVSLGCPLSSQLAGLESHNGRHCQACFWLSMTATESCIRLLQACCKGTACCEKVACRSSMAV